MYIFGHIQTAKFVHIHINIYNNQFYHDVNDGDYLLVECL